MLDAEQKGYRQRRHVAGLREYQLLDVDTSRDGMDIAGIIRSFYQRDRASSARPTLQTQPAWKTTGHAHWTEMTRGEPGMMPNVDLVTPLDIDYAEGLDDILSLATNYLN
jgi:hypothetical protein